MNYDNNNDNPNNNINHNDNDNDDNDHDCRAANTIARLLWAAAKSS